MISLSGMSLSSFPIADLRRTTDLIYFDGPLLSVYEHTNGEKYLYYWCDADDKVNRWMILRIDEASVLRLVNRIVPLGYVIPKGCRDDFVYFVDFATDRKPHNVVLTPVSNVPESYRPEDNCYLDAVEHRQDASSYAVLVEGNWSVREIGDFPSLFSKVYSLLYWSNVLHLKHQVQHPWRGGFSAMHFFNWLADAVPRQDRAYVSAIQYSSPGFMRFRLNGKIAEQVTKCLFVFKANKDFINAQYDDLATYIRKNRLNEIWDENSPEWTRHNSGLISRTIDLMRPFAVLDGNEFVELCSKPFEAVKIAMAFCRYIKTLCLYESRGLVRYPATDAE